MGIEDRDYYRESYAKRQGMRYNATKATYSSAHVEDGPRPQPGEAKRPPPKRPSVAQKAVGRLSGLPDLPLLEYHWSLKFLILSFLGFCVYGLVRLFRYVIG